MSNPIIPLLPASLRQQLSRPTTSDSAPASVNTESDGRPVLSEQLVELLSTSSRGRSLLDRLAAASAGQTTEVAAKVAKNFDQLSTGATNRRTSLLDLLVTEQKLPVQVRLSQPAATLPKGLDLQLLNRSGQWFVRSAPLANSALTGPSNQLSATSGNSNTSVADSQSLPAGSGSRVMSASIGNPSGNTPALPPLTTALGYNGKTAAAGLTQASPTAPSTATSATPASSPAATPTPALSSTTNITSNTPNNNPTAAQPDSLPSGVKLPNPELLQRWVSGRQALLPMPPSAAPPSASTNLYQPQRPTNGASSANTTSSPATATADNHVAASQRLLGALAQVVQSRNPALRQILQNFVQQLPTSEQLGTQQGVRSALQQSGLFMESSLFALANGTEDDSASRLLQEANRLFGGLNNNADNLLAGQRDIKAVLGRLLAASQPGAQADNAEQPTLLRLQTDSGASPLQRQLQTALADIELQQHRLITQHQAPDNSGLDTSLLYRQQERPAAVAMSWHPDDDSSHEQTHKSTAKAQWRLQLQLELDGIGCVQIDARIGWPKLAVTFWSQNPDSLRQLHQQLPGLRQRLQAAGAEVNDLDARFGQAPSGNQTRIQRSLVDLFT
ncbi:flagellar hook-length control protein FliK [Parathalassolituus penaei]|uniref:Flagellar hook-length control protein FliK n=1 Tax=Parathalassolituus penaei TaxID=2997323 RepID=A0A9X3IQG2_9GAMM|nr:flagellar hook-length control protein FliK [Parathalassolituus penaei]MCY0963756.1 flagellar hook-length control protein FliK [Parathalassolituus penaei]